VPWPTCRSIVPTVVFAAAALILAGCGSDTIGAGSDNNAASTPSPPLAATADSAATAATSSPAEQQAGVRQDARTITVRVADGKVTPKAGRITVARGTQVRLVVTSDVADEVHVHAYDKEVRLTPGKAAVLEFTADQTGLFEVETHETKLILFQLLVR
jgi:cupredoxin-like protein